MGKIKTLCGRYLEGEEVELRGEAEIRDDDLDMEDRVESVILRVYNNDPAVFIKINLEEFIQKVVDELETEGQKLQQINYALTSKNEDTYASVTSNDRKFRLSCHRV